MIKIKKNLQIDRILQMRKEMLAKRVSASPLILHSQWLCDDGVFTRFHLSAWQA